MEEKILMDLPCEQIVIGTLLNRQGEWLENADILSDGLFYDWRTKALYKAAKAIVDRGGQADVITMLPELERQKANVSPQDLAEISNHVSIQAVRPYVLRLLDMQRRRDMARIAMRLNADAHDESKSVEQAQTAAQGELNGLLVTASTSIKTLADVGRDFTEDYITANRKGERRTGLPTGFKVADDMGGFQLGDLWVIAAESSQGKTSLAINVADNVARHGMAVAFYSMEMTAAQLYARMVAARTGIPSSTICTRPLTDGQMEVYHRASTEMGQCHVYFDERSTSSLETILASIRTLAYRKDIKMAVVDYLQILNVNTKSLNQEQALGDAARRFKNIAKELNICVVVLSQLSRDRDNPRPNIARLRGSGQILEAADGVWLVYRPEYYGARYGYPEPYSQVSTHGTAMIDVAKGRNIGTRKFIVGFDSSLTRFYDLPQDRLPTGGREEAGKETGDDVPF